MNSFNIVCISDEAYAQHTAVMLASLFDTNREKKIQIFILTQGLSTITITQLKSIVPENSQLQVITKTNKELPIIANNNELGGKYWNPIMYLKLFMPRFLGENVHRLLFLDVDMVINADIAPLYNIELKDNIIAGAEDWKYSIDHKIRIGLNKDAMYINSGVMVVDIDKWRKYENKNPISQYLEIHRDSIQNDQDAFALYFQNKIKYINQQWNVTTYYFERKPRVFNKYFPILEELRTNPFIIHYCEPIKPWFKECKHPYRFLYKKYLKQTPWHNYRFPSCKTHFGKPAWRYTVKHWLNIAGIRHDDWSMITLNP
ncbi:MAG: General stress protein A [Bacteroides rodentium]